MREMKNSGIDWIGDIPSGWRVCKLKKIIKFFNGYAFDSNVLKSDGLYPVVRIGDIINGKVDFSKANKIDEYGDFLNRFTIEPDDVVIAMSGATVGKMGYIKKVEVKSFINQRVGIIRSDINKFVYYYLSSEAFLKYIQLLSEGTAQPNISTENINNYYITQPSKTEINRIVSFLDEKCAEIDRVIEKTKATIEEYKKLKQSVITQAVTKGIRPNRPMKDSGIEWIGKIPADWSVRKLKTFTTQISKGATPKDMSTEKTDFYSIRFLKSENIVDNQLMSVPEFYIEESIHSGELKRSQLSDNDIMFVIAGASIGKVAIVSNELLPANTNQAMSFIRVLEKYREIKKYLWYVLQSDIMKLFITLYSVQSAQPNISMENLGNFRLCVPADFQEIKDILLYLNIKCLEIDELIAKKTSLLSELESYKKSLIYEYVTGKKEV